MNLRRTYMVNGEFVEYVNPNSPGVGYVCECGASCPQGRCFETLRRGRADPYEGHRGDEGEYDEHRKAPASREAGAFLCSHVCYSKERARTRGDQGCTSTTS